MKKIWILLFLPLMACNDWLNIASEEDVNYANYFKNEKEVAAAVTSMFVTERKVFAPSGIMPFDYAGLLCDELYKEGYKQLDVDVFYQKYYTGQSWGGFYSLIYLANTLEENRWRFRNITEERGDYWLAQANFMKALAYFRVAQMWGDAPIAKGSEDLEPLPKSPVEDVLAEAIRSAEKALILPTWDKLTDANGNAVSSRQYASIGTVYTLLANIYAWMGGLYGKADYWEKAEAYATRVIGDGAEGQAAGVYALEEDIPSLVTNVFGKVRKSPEIIFSISRVEEDESYYYMTTYGKFYPAFGMLTYPNFAADPSDARDGLGEMGTLDARISVNTVKELFPEADARRQEYWYQLGEVTYKDGTTSPYAYLNKWRDYAISENEANDRPIVAVECNKVIWRLADLKLLRAECRTRLSRTDAVDDLNDVRRRAGLGNYNGMTDMATLRKEIFLERERELYGEGHRYYDVVRNAFFPRNNFYLRQLSDTYANLTDAEIENGALYLPVGESAFTKNPYMKQNTYWLWRK